MKKVAVIGHGYVGKSVARFFREHFPLVIYDHHHSSLPQVHEADWEREFGKPAIFTTQNHSAVNECDLAVVCVPTPMFSDGSVNLGHINAVFSWLKVPLVLIKSTIPPGTVEKLSAQFPNLKIAFSPEYIGEGKYQVQWWKDKNYPHPTDMKYHDFQIFGGDPTTTSAIIPFFQKVVGPEPKMIQTDSRTAELCKYMENSWGYMKVMFCNEFYDIAKAFGVDYHELRELWLLDGRVERMHTAVFIDNRKVGGKCFPKDVNGIVKASEAAGFEPKLLKAVLNKNEEINEA